MIKRILSLVVVIATVISYPSSSFAASPQGDSNGKSEVKVKKQVSYEVKFMVKDTNQPLVPYKVKKIGFVGEEVREEARDFEGYKLVSDKYESKVKIVTLVDKNDPITFYYKKITDEDLKETETETEENEEMSEEVPFEEITQVRANKKEIPVDPNHLQVTYSIDYLDENNNSLKGYTVKKIGFEKDVVKEEAETFEGYRLVSEKTVEKTLEFSGRNNDITFRYEKISKENLIIYKSDNENMGKVLSKGEVVKKGKKLDGSIAIPKEGYRFVCWKNSNDKNVCEKTVFLPKEKDNNFEKSNEITYTAYFRALKPSDDEPLKDFLKKKIDYDEPTHYQDINFIGKKEKLKEYITKKVCTRCNYARFICTENEKNEALFELFDQCTLASGIRYQKGYEIEEKKYGKQTEYKIIFKYMTSKEDMQKAEEKIDKILDEVIKENMTEAEKVKALHDYIIDKTTLAIDRYGNTIKPKLNAYTNYFATSVILEGKGVCEAYAVAFNRLLERSGIEARLMVGYTYPKYCETFMKNTIDRIKSNAETKEFFKDINHAWNQVKIEGKWYNIDIYHNDYYDEKHHLKQYKEDDEDDDEDDDDGAFSTFDNKSRYEFYLKSDEYMKTADAARIWNKNFAEEAKENYKKK